VTSEIAKIESPAPLIARSEESRPDPGPLTNTSTASIPFSSAFFAASSTASDAAYGVDFLAPLKPFEPDELQDTASPLSFVIVTRVLLNVAVIYTFPFLPIESVDFFRPEDDLPLVDLVPFDVVFVLAICYFFAGAFAAGAAPIPIFAATSFLIAPIVIRLPRLVRAFDLVLCPRAGKLRMCLCPL
jgi:hypothetical protein